MVLIILQYLINSKQMDYNGLFESAAPIQQIQKLKQFQNKKIIIHFYTQSSDQESQQFFDGQNLKQIGQEDSYRLLQSIKSTGMSIINLSIMKKIGFCQLRILNLMSCSLVSIQQIITISAPLLTKLNISDNLITSLSPVNKANFPDLQIINLDINYFVQANKMSEAQIKNLRNIILDRVYWASSIENLSFILKMQTFSLKQLYLSSVSRFSHAVIQEKISQKYLKSIF